MSGPEEPEETNYFVRGLIIALSCGVAVLIYYNFFVTEPKGEISVGLLTLISFLIVLTLAESFDKFSVGQIASISRKVNEVKEENKELKEKNSELINQLISITNITNQTSTHTSVYGDLYTGSGQKEQITNEVEYHVKQLLKDVQRNAVIDEMVENIEKELKSRSLSYDSPTEKVLIKYLADAQLLLQFEQTYNVIFGSQISLLKRINTLGRMTQGELQAFVGGVFQQFPDQFRGWDLDSYLAYLYNSLLITNDKENDNKVGLTVRGVEFLAWMTRSGKEEKKGL